MQTLLDGPYLERLELFCQVLCLFIHSDGGGCEFVKYEIILQTEGVWVVSLLTTIGAWATIIIPRIHTIDTTVIRLCAREHSL